MWLMCTSNYKYPVTKRLNYIPIIKHPHDHTLIMCREPIKIGNFVIDAIILVKWWLVFAQTEW